MSSSIALGAHLLSGQPGYRQAGIHQYIRALLEHLPAAAPDLSFTALISPTALAEAEAARAGAGNPANMRLVAAPESTESPLRRIWHEQRRAAGEARAAGAALYHGMAFALPLNLACPATITLYDLSFIDQPRAHKRLNRWYLRWITGVACRRARRVITISTYTGLRAQQLFGVQADRIDAIPLGVSAGFTRPSADALAAFRQARGIGSHAIFSLGSLEPRKNLPGLIDAFAAVASAAPEAHPQLFIGGSLGWGYDAIFARLRAHGLAESVHMIGRVPAADLPLWYAACSAFAYPSLYEGFGLPPLEAMACGAAVITSSTTALPEVAGDAALLVDPRDTAALAAALLRILDDAGLRAELARKGTARAAQFTWQRTAARTAEAYRRILA